MARPEKATSCEKADYKANGPIYPLYGTIKIDGHRCVIEDLRGTWGGSDPIYEIIAPPGMMFSPDETHSMLCHTLADCTERAEGVEVCESNDN